MVKKLSLLFLLFVALSSHAQTEIDTSALLNALNQAPFIFEGKVIEQCTYEEPNSGIIYTNNIMEITKVIKGNLQCGTVSMITEGGEYLDRYMEVTHTTKFNVNVTGIFACNPNPYYYGNSCPSTSNTQILTPMLREFSEIHYYDDYVNDIAEGFNSQFHDINELYDFIQNFAGLSINDCNQQFRPQDWESNDWKKVEKIPFVEDNSWNTKYQTLAVGDQVKYTFGSQSEITTDAASGQKYYECDIRIQANDNGSYLEQGAFRLKYNPKAFGTFIAGSVQKTLGANFTSSYNGSGGFQVIDKSDSVLSFIIKRTSGARTQITTTPQIVFRMKVPFDSCQYYPELEMIDTFSTVATYNRYSVSASGGTLTSYDTTLAIDSIQGVTCEPIILGINSKVTGKDTVTAGNHEPIEIRGKHFGSSKHELYMPNADEGGIVYLKLDPYDIINWSDTLITMILPSFVVDTFGGYNSNAPGSGRIRLKNKWGVQNDIIYPHKDSIFVKWCLNGYNKYYPGLTDYKKSFNLLFSRFNGGGYKFQFHPNVNDPLMRSHVLSAINYIRCATGVDLSIDTQDAPNNSSFGQDSINLIKLDYSLSVSSPVIAVCRQFATPSFTTSDSLTPFPVIEIDIRINPYRSFTFDSTGTVSIPNGMEDFYGIVLHELGHGISLRHVNDSNDLMYCFQPSTPTIPSSRKTFLSQWNFEAADTIVHRSNRLSSYSINCAVPIYNMTIQNMGDSCRVPLSNSIIPTLNSEIRIYPNPFKNILTIDINKPYQRATLFIYDIYGKMVVNKELTNNHNQVQTDQCVPGVYIIAIKIDETWTYNRLISSDY